MKMINLLVEAFGAFENKLLLDLVAVKDGYFWYLLEGEVDPGGPALPDGAVSVQHTAEQKTGSVAHLVRQNVPHPFGRVANLGRDVDLWPRLRVGIKILAEAAGGGEPRTPRQYHIFGQFILECDLVQLVETLSEQLVFWVFIFKLFYKMSGRRIPQTLVLDCGR